MLAFLAKEPCHGYELWSRLQTSLGPLGGGLNTGQVYMTLRRLERAELVEAATVERDDALDRKVYTVTPKGRARVQVWLSAVTWDKQPATEFHLKLVAAAGGLADPIALIDAQRAELIRRLADAQRTALAHPGDATPALLLAGVILRLEADLEWLDLCVRHWQRSGATEA
ncbi:PadR family transcriptional regulator [Jiangella anatolica]|nr:PadR family transcriptional regulator [Jiangella anatolica]